MPRPRQTPSHGTRSRYNSSHSPCRCGSCRAANAAWLAQYRARRAQAQARHRHTD